jgi:two-component system sensor histidine kinase PilS (NtrC family)
MEKKNKIAPCRFSRRYRIDADQAWQSLKIFFLYRVALATLVVYLFIFGNLPSSLLPHSSPLFGRLVSVYLAVVAVAGIPLILRRPGYAIQAQAQILVDIAFIPAIMHALGGVTSGVGALLGLTVAAGGILVGGRCALLFAAVASIAVLGEELYAGMHDYYQNANFTYAGMLGASYFGIALLALVLARRAERSEAIAEQRGTDMANLEQLNEFIIRHLQSGILVVDDSRRIRLYNESAARLLPVPLEQLPLDAVCPTLARQFREWQQDQGKSSVVLQTEGGPAVQARFTHLGLTRPPIHMIFLEDSALHNERVQQSKLASLGRLTASIAHEIRNPLSGISHASQLLAESPLVDSNDGRLIRIILDQSARLNKIVENVLQLSRRGQALRETIPLSATVARFLKDFEQEQAVAPETFRLEPAAPDPKVSVDASHLKQILANLCSNALKYGRPDLGPIVLRVARHPEGPCVEVIDHARPIDPVLVPSLFEPFFTTSATGTGLGLYIARELAELNQARLEYADIGAGPCFRLYLSDSEKTVVEL